MKLIAQQYISRGLIPIPCRPNTKAAYADNWTDPAYRPGPDAFNDGDNIGLRLDKHIVTDAENERTSALARLLLDYGQPTLMHGRGTDLRSHLWFNGIEGAKYQKWELLERDPVTNHKSIFEVLTGSNRHVLAPPSTHPSGQSVLFADPDTPILTLPSWDMFHERCVDIAVGGFVLHYWQSFGHDSMGMLAGALLHAGWSEQRLRTLYRALGHIEPACATDMMNFARTTAARFNGGETVTGFKTLGDTVGGALANQLSSFVRSKPEPIQVQPALSYTAKELATVDFPPRQAFLKRESQPFFSRGDIGEIFATRGIGKTWLLATLALMVSNGQDAIGFEVPEPLKVLYVDGEMARQDVRDRFQLLSERLALPLNDHLVIVAADWQPDFLPRVDTPEGQKALEHLVEAADLIIFDNRSCLFNPEGEKDPSAWQPTQEYLLSLRRRGKGVLLAHHANRQGGARGLGKPEDVMNLVMKLEHPEDYSPDQGARFICDITPPDGKARGVWGPAAVPFEVALTTTGWNTVKHAGGKMSDATIRQQIIDELNLRETAQDSPKSANAALKSVPGNRTQKLKVWAQMIATGEIIRDAKRAYSVGTLAVSPF